MVLNSVLRDVANWRGRCVQRVCNGVMRKMLFRKKEACEQTSTKKEVYFAMTVSDRKELSSKEL